MGSIQISSIRSPFEEPELYPRVTRFLRRAESMGLIDEPIEELSPVVVRRLARALASRGLARDGAARLAGREPSRDEYVAYLDAASRALDESPVPTAELRKLEDVLGLPLALHLLDISAASLQRYQRGERETPGGVADRAHFLTSIVAALEGIYNEPGIRRWFERPRTSFGGRTARQLLSRQWTPSAAAAVRVLEAAESARQLGAT